MKSALSVLLLCLLVIQCTIPWRHALSGDDALENMPFDKTAFIRNLELARSLAEDDHAAWWTSDSITAQQPHRLDTLDDTWFVLQSDRIRRVYYGRYLPQEQRYLAKYAFQMLEDRTITTLSTDADSAVTHVASVVYIGTRHFNNVLDSLMLDFKFNHYVRQLPDGSFSMWFLPAGTGNYCAYGIEVHLTISPAADSITSTTITGNELRYFEPTKPASDVTLDNTYDDVPSLSNLFFTLTNISFFSQITITNQHSLSTAKKSPFFPDGLFWEHTPVR